MRVTDSGLNKTSGAVVTTFTAITADFNSRAKTTAPVPAGMFGYGRGEALRGTSDRELLTQAGLTEARLSASHHVRLRHANTQLDSDRFHDRSSPEHGTTRASSNSISLRHGCSQPLASAPAVHSQHLPNVSEWAQIAASYVAHFDSKFPGVVQDYEIWNEPNATGMCATVNQMSTYMNIYATAAPAMKAQAAQDGATIRIGGPVLSGYSQLWISTLLTNASTAPYVDFVSYHQYIFGQSQLEAKWDRYTDVPSLYEMTQDPSVRAPLRITTRLWPKSHLASNQGGAKTPVYVTEYNSNWAFFKDCCRNDSTYAPVWNALYVTDMLDSVYNGSAHVPDKLYYFAGNAYPYFCLIGVHDTNMDCSVFGGCNAGPLSAVLRLSALRGDRLSRIGRGGYMAKSISTPTGGGGLATTAFFTSTQDSVVIINPTSTSYPQISVTFANPGFSDTQGTLYQIQNGSEITSTPIAFYFAGS